MKIVILGAGNLGFHLANRLHECGEKVLQVFSRKKNKAEEVAEMVMAQAIDHLEDVRADADLYILAVRDDAIEEVAKKLAKSLPPEKLVVHTSGVTPSIILGNFFQQFGVFYPLQTLSRKRQTDFSSIPICVFASNELNTALLEKLGRKISKQVFFVDDKKRATLHVAAVFANNFVNHCYQISSEILQKANLPFEVLQPLIQETAAKIQQNQAADMQTGPAIRGDEVSLKKHIAFLEKQHPDYVNIYKQLSNSINPDLNINLL